MASELKTKPTGGSVAAFIAASGRAAECRAVMALMEKATGQKPRMWGASIVGFGSYAYTYDSGRSGEWPVVGLSPRKSALTLYIMPGFAGYEGLLDKLGRHKTGKSCLYLKSLAGVDMKVLEELIRRSVAAMRARYG